jgi:nucleotide-binding universal stress UspA family protein
MRVLVPVDGSDPSDEALSYALEQFGDDDIVALYVMDPVDGATAWGPGSADDWLSAAEERADDVLEGAAETASEAGVEITTDTTIGRPAHAIVEYADEHGIDHVVVGSHSREGISRVLLGSVAETVVRRAPIPVTVARSRERPQ